MYYDPGALLKWAQQQLKKTFNLKNKKLIAPGQEGDLKDIK